MSKYRGIDISYHNGDLNLAKMDVDFVIVRAGYGKGNKDKKFADYMKQLSKTKKKVGIYWFSYAYTEKMAEAEARACLKIIKNYDIDYPIFFDWEYDSMRYAKEKGIKVTASLICKMTDRFCKTIQSAGYETGYYFNKEYYDKYYKSFSLQHSTYYTWFARYNKTMGTMPVNIDIWQFTENGVVSGSSKKFDVNYSYRNEYDNKQPNKTASKKKHYDYTETVKDIQKIIGAKIDGICGTETINKLPTLFVRQDSGKLVQDMQKLLKHEHGYTLGGYGCDGQFGVSTEKALIKFQKSVGITADGICGKITWKYLMKRGD